MASDPPSAKNRLVHVLFVQGGSTGAYEEDALLASSLRDALGPGFEVRYPQMADEDDPDVDVWGRQIDRELAAMGDDVVVVGHSIGASVVLKHLSEAPADPRIRGIVLLETPSWGADDFWSWEECTIDPAAAGRLAGRVPVVLFHAVDDEAVPFSHLARNAANVKGSITREVPTGGHQLDNDLGLVARDVRTIAEGGSLR